MGVDFGENAIVIKPTDYYTQAKVESTWTLHLATLSHRHSGERRNPGNTAKCAFLDTGLRRCDEVDSAGLALCSFHPGISLD